MGTTINTAYKVQADLLESESNISIENGTLHVINNELKVHLNDEIKTIQTSNYKVFTALLTQSGEGDPRNVPSDTNSLIKGITYEIVSVGAGEDMTLYGAPNNDPGTYFICTVDTEVFTSELNYNQAAPVATVLENTIGNIWFTYSSDGQYFCYSEGLFINPKSTITLGNVTWDGGSGIIKAGFDGEVGIIITADYNNEPVNNYAIFNTPIEIRVYN